MANITYADKVALNENPSIAAINKVSDTDMNQIKNVINSTIIKTLMGGNGNIWNSSDSYDIGDITTYNYMIYINLTGTNTNTNPANDTTNWQEYYYLGLNQSNQLIPSFIVNSANNSANNTYGCTYINQLINPLQTYGSEVKIGKWFNEDLYRQCFEIPYAGGNTKILDFAYGQNIKSMKAMLIRNDGYASDISWNSPTAGAGDFGILYVHWQNNAIMFNSSFAGTICLTIEYTKNANRINSNKKEQTKGE